MKDNEIMFDMLNTKTGKEYFAKYLDSLLKEKEMNVQYDDIDCTWQTKKFLYIKMFYLTNEISKVYRQYFTIIFDYDGCTLYFNDMETIKIHPKKLLRQFKLEYLFN